MGRNCAADMKKSGELFGAGPGPWALMPYSRCMAALAAPLLPPAPAPSGGDAALEGSSAAVITQGRGASALPGGAGRPSGAPHPTLTDAKGRTEQGGATHRRGGGAQTEPRRPEGSTVPPPSASEKPFAGQGRPGDCALGLGSVRAAGRR